MNEVELDLEDAGITLDPIEWQRVVIDSRDNTDTLPHSYIPDGVINYLRPVFAGFMLMPCAVFQNRSLTVKQEIVNDIEEFKTRIANLGSPAFLYMVSYIPNQPVFKQVDNQGEVIELDPPQMISSTWRIRYATLGD